ncbi:FUSC family protein [Nonomuraea sp. CA-218870]|uniref:FUSC family protein n=1 Tax=Nonomuraea sp. CA-218870 TaxID=3239998 RepID=UPI003D8FDEE4
MGERSRQLLPPFERIGRTGRLILERARRLGPGGWLRAERDPLLQGVKTTAACVLAWWIAARLLEARMPVLAPIGVLLTISATAYSTVVRGVQQVGAVVVGLAGAGALIYLLGVNAITLAILVAGGLVLTPLLNLPKQNVQIPITGLLVFALGAGYSLERLIDLLLGAVIGILANLVVLPPRYVEDARKELAELAGDMASLTADMGKGVRGTWGEDEARSWLERSREVDARLRESQEVAEQAAESVKLMPLERRRQDQRLDQVSEAMTCLDHAGLQLRALARSLTDLAAGVRGLPAEDVDRVPAALGDELMAISRAFAAFGRLQLGRGSVKDLGRLRTALREGGEHQTLAAERVPDTENVRLWSLHGAMLDHCAAIRHELDPEGGPHQGAFPARLIPG